MVLILILFLLVIFSFLFWQNKLSRKNPKLKLPPSPPKLPIIGNLHQLLGSGTHPHRSLQALSNKYGPLMFMHLGFSPTLVVSSPDIAREIIESHDIVFSNRPKTTAANVFLYGCKDIAFSPYGEYWRQARKACVLGLLNIKKVQSLQYIREEEVAVMINKIRSSCFINGGSVNLTEILLAVSNNIISRSVFGRRAEEDEDEEAASGKNIKFGELSRKMMIQFASFSFRDMFPYLGWLDFVTGHIGRLNASARQVDALFDQVIEEHRRILASDNSHGQSSDKKDLVHTLLKLQKDGRIGIDLTQDNLKALILDMFLGGTETISTTVEWAMAELVKNPKLMKKSQEEIRGVVKNKSNINTDDINQMNYLKCVIKETLRLHPAAPLLPPRETSTSINMRGYDIPAKTTLHVNAWAIQRDPTLWKRAEEFLPERFMNNNAIDFKGQDFEFIPFGAGRRVCPGMSLGLATIEYFLSNLLYCFDWKLPGESAVDDEKNLDMSEVYGLTVSKKLPLLLVPTLYSTCG